MKIDFVADTNFLIYLHEGNIIIEPLLAYNFGITFISEIELLGFPGLSKSDEVKLKMLVDDCYELDWNSKVKAKTIHLKKNYSIKLPDAIIAATSIIYELPLVTADKAFSKIKEMDLILIEI